MDKKNWVTSLFETGFGILANPQSTRNSTFGNQRKFDFLKQSFGTIAELLNGRKLHTYIWFPVKDYILIHSEFVNLVFLMIKISSYKSNLDA